MNGTLQSVLVHWGGGSVYFFLQMVQGVQVVPMQIVDDSDTFLILWSMSCSEYPFYFWLFVLIILVVLFAVKRVHGLTANRVSSRNNLQAYVLDMNSPEN